MQTWTVSLTLRRFECGSVQMKPASTSFSCSSSTLTLHEWYSTLRSPVFIDTIAHPSGLAGNRKHVLASPSACEDVEALVTLPRPRMRLMQKVSSSRDSSSARTQCRGGCRYRPHPRQKKMVTCRVHAHV